MFGKAEAIAVKFPIQMVKMSEVMGCQLKRTDCKLLSISASVHLRKLSEAKLLPGAIWTGNESLCYLKSL